MKVAKKGKPGKKPVRRPPPKPEPRPNGSVILMPDQMPPSFTAAPIPSAPLKPQGTAPIMLAAVVAVIAVLAGAAATVYVTRVHPTPDTTTQIIGYVAYSLFAVAVVATIVLVSSALNRITSDAIHAKAHTEDLEEKTAEAQKRAEEIEAASQELAESKADVARILDTVSQGLFLMDAQSRFGGDYSKEVLRIFRLTDLNGRTLLDVLKSLVPERIHNTTKDFVDLLFDAAKKERTVMQVNPLASIEVNFPDPQGGFESRYLSFAFRRIVENSVISQVFVAVSDITERTLLEAQLRQSEAHKERQFTFLLGVLHVDPKQLDDFLVMARENVAIMSAALRTPDGPTVSAGQLLIFRQRLDTIGRSVHAVKGNAQLLKLSYFANLCERFETTIASVRNKSALSSDDFLTIVMAQSELSKDLDGLQEVRERFIGSARLGDAAGVRGGGGGSRKFEGDDLLESVASLAAEIAMSSGKEVRVESADFDSRALPPKLRRAVKDVVVQLVRNSVAHGVELPRERELLGKPRAATLSIMGRASSGASSFSFSVRDDGRGLDPEHIRDKAVARGLITAEAAKALESREVIGLLFRPGFSTVDVANADAGRGFGMNIIKDIVIDKCSGELGINSEPLQFTEFTITIPVGPTLLTATTTTATA